MKSKEIIQLENQIKKYAKSYYSGKEEITDFQYDQLIEKLRFLDPENELILGLASESEEEFSGEKIKHDLITGTLAKCKNEDEFKRWIRLHPAEKFCLEFKIDGTGYELKYRNGRLISVVSRGNGYEGIEKLELFQNFIKDVPCQLKSNFTGSIRGEAVILEKEFQKNFPEMKNPRNATAGLLNRKFEDWSEDDQKKLRLIHFIAYDLLDRNNKLDNSEIDKLVFLKFENFQVPNFYIVSSVEEILKIRQQVSDQRSEVPYGIDGLVIKPVIADKEDLKEKCPKKSCAIKFDLAPSVTKVVAIEWQLSGEQLCPIGLVEPVMIDGVVVKRASLCNLNIIKNLGIQIGSLVEIIRSGEVIPKIIRVVG